jgi:hypothetical protein
MSTLLEHLQDLKRFHDKRDTPEYRTLIWAMVGAHLDELITLAAFAQSESVPMPKGVADMIANQQEPTEDMRRAAATVAARTGEPVQSDKQNAAPRVPDGTAGKDGVRASPSAPAVAAPYGDVNEASAPIFQHSFSAQMAYFLSAMYNCGHSQGLVDTHPEATDKQREESHAYTERVRTFADLAVKRFTQSATRAIPEGWKLVPVEATNEMQWAANDYAEATKDRPKGMWWWNRLYQAMLAAAPSPLPEER